MDMERAGRYFGVFILTERNQPAASLFSGCRFRFEGESGRRVLEKSDKAPETPDWFTVES